GEPPRLVRALQRRAAADQQSRRALRRRDAGADQVGGTALSHAGEPNVDRPRAGEEGGEVMRRTISCHSEPRSRRGIPRGGGFLVMLGMTLALPLFAQQQTTPPPPAPPRPEEAWS